MFGNKMFCYHCFHMIELGQGDFCPECGKKHSVHYAQSFELPAGTYLKGNRYMVGACIGTGGFGISYVGYDFFEDRRVLVKETYYTNISKRNCLDRTKPNPLMVEYSNNFSLEKIIQKTEKECRSLSEAKGLDNIVKIYDWFSENNTAYIITELIDGVTMEEKVMTDGRYMWHELKKKIIPLMHNLSMLHHRGIIHRDIKPQNIMIRNDTGEFVLIDFGLARSLETSTLASIGLSFTPGYAPFEQRSLNESDNTYTDVYSLAATIYFALTGEPPCMEMKDTIDENFPLLNTMRIKYGISENVIRALRYALNPNYHLRCSSIGELIKMLNVDEKIPPHYLKGNPKSYLTSQPETIVRSSEEKKIIREDYEKRRQEEKKQYEKRQSEISDNVGWLIKRHKNRGSKNDVNPINFKKFIPPAIVVLIMIIFLIVTKK